MTLRLLLSALALCAIVATGVAIGWRGDLLRSLAWGGLYAAALQSVEHSRAYIRAFEVLRYEAASTVAERVLTIAGGLAGLLVLRTPDAVLAGMALGLAVSLTGTTVWVHRVLARFDARQLSVAFVRGAVSRALPIGVFGMFSMLILGLPPVLIERFAGRAEAGVYGAAFRLVDAAMLLPAIVSTALTPRLSALAAGNKHSSAQRVVGRSLLFLGTAVVAVVAALFFGAPLVAEVFTGGARGFEALPELLRASTGLFAAMSFTFVITLSLIALGEPWSAAAALGVACVVSLTALGAGLPAAAQPSLFTLFVLTLAYTAVVIVCGLRLWRLLASPH